MPFEVYELVDPKAGQCFMDSSNFDEPEVNKKNYVMCFHGKRSFGSQKNWFMGFGTKKKQLGSSLRSPPPSPPSTLLVKILRIF
jgi:phage replication-related protein YjqB (UPF0714/DUF867 family)